MARSMLIWMSQLQNHVGENNYGGNSGIPFIIANFNRLYGGCLNQVSQNRPQEIVSYPTLLDKPPCSKNKFCLIPFTGTYVFVLDKILEKAADLKKGISGKETKKDPLLL